MTYDTLAIRHGFPALARTLDGHQVAYLDGPGGTQVHDSVIEAMSDFMTRGGSNLGGSFVTSRETDDVLAAGRLAVADLFGAQPNEIVFGQNMTSLTYAMSHALARTWAAGDNIVLTRLDHDANVSPWMQAAADSGVEVRFVDFDPEAGCDLDLGTLDVALDRERDSSPSRMHRMPWERSLRSPE
jgi:selenocysteine lyase/cysteine desulfurase